MREGWPGWGLVVLNTSQLEESMDRYQSPFLGGNI